MDKMVEFILKRLPFKEISIPLYHKMRKFIIYCLIGFTGLIIDVLAVYIFKEKLKQNEYLANGIGMILGMLNNFTLNAMFNFKTKDKLFERFIPYFFVWIFTLGVSTLILKIFYEKLGLNFWIIKGFSVIVVAIIGYSINKKISFNKTTLLSKEGRNSHTYTLFLIILTFIITSYLRFWEIGKFSLWRDEAFTAILSTHTIKDIIQISINDTNPPLHTLLLKIWGSLFGISEISLRIPSAIFSILTTYYVYLFSKKYFKQENLFFALILYATNIVSIYYAQEVRAYSMLTFFVIASTYHLEKILENFKLKHQILFIVYSILGIYTHNLAIFILFIQCLWIFYTLASKYINQKYSFEKIAKDKLFQKWLLTGGIILLFSIPWIIPFYRQSQKINNEGFWLNFNPLESITSTIFDLISGIRLYCSGDIGILNYLVGLFAFLLMIKATRKVDIVSYFTWATLLFFYLLAFYKTFVYVRYLSFLTPFFVLMIYKGILNVTKDKYLHITFATIFIFMNILNFTKYHTIPDVKEENKKLFEKIQEHIQSNDLVLNMNSLSYFPYEYYRLKLKYVSDMKEPLKQDLKVSTLPSYIYDPNNSTPYYVGKALMPKDIFIDNINTLLKYDRIWTIEMYSDTSHKLLEEYFYLCKEEYFYGNLNLKLWTQNEESCDSNTNLQ